MENFYATVRQAPQEFIYPSQSLKEGFIVTQVQRVKWPAQGWWQTHDWNNLKQPAPGAKMKRKKLSLLSFAMPLSSSLLTASIQGPNLAAYLLIGTDQLCFLVLCFRANILSGKASKEMSKMVIDSSNAPE